MRTSCLAHAHSRVVVPRQLLPTTQPKYAYRWSGSATNSRLSAYSSGTRAIVLSQSRIPGPSGRSIIVDEPELETSNSPFIQQIVKLETIHAIPRFLRPWEVDSDVKSVSSGFILDVDKRWILTTAGAVDYPRRINAFRIGDPEPYVARVLDSCADCDAALITVDSDEFWHDAQQINWGKLPHLQAKVTAVGFPEGGDTFCVTSGVVSRVEVIEYAHSQRNLLGLQVDAPLNNGVWGGPVLNARGQVVGMALQKFSTQTWWERYDAELGGGRFDGDEGQGDDGSDSDDGEDGDGDDDDDDDADDGPENVGYVAPAAVLQHFLRDYVESQQSGMPWRGFPALGLQSSGMESDALRASLRLQHHQGIVVRRVFPMSGCTGLLQPDDVILEIDGVAVACDGSVPLRPGQRISHSYLISRKQVGATASLLIQRAGQQLRITVPVTRPQYIIPPSLESQQPPYLIFGGLIFLTLSIPLLMELPQNPEPEHGHALCVLLGQLENEQPRAATDEVVVVCGSLVCDAVDEYTHMLGQHPKQVMAANGVEVRSMKQLAKLLLGCREQFVRLELGTGQVVVLESKGLRRQTEQVLRRNGIRYAMSKAIRAELKTSWPAAVGSEGRLKLQRAARARG